MTSNLAIAIDANVLIAAAGEDHPHWGAASAAVESLPQQNDVIYLFWPVIMAYLRVTTFPGLFANPLDFETAWGNVQALQRLPHVRSLAERDGFADVFQQVAAESRATGRLVHDAHIVALMRQYAVGTIWTYDRDFRRFDGIRVVEP